jgi:hypothetical protein
LSRSFESGVAAFARSITSWNGSGCCPVDADAASIRFFVVFFRGCAGCAAAVVESCAAPIDFAVAPFAVFDFCGAFAAAESAGAAATAAVVTAAVFAGRVTAALPERAAVFPERVAAALPERVAVPAAVGVAFVRVAGVVARVVGVVAPDVARGAGGAVAAAAFFVADVAVGLGV